MNAKQKLGHLTNSWYGYSLFAAVVSVLGIRASGLLSFAIGFGLTVAFNAVGFVISVAIVTFFGRKLLSGSGGTRLFLVVVSGLCTVLGALGTLGAAWLFLHDWSLATLLEIAASGAWTMLCARSFAVLGETDVRAHFV
jgi:hypothetical protein